MTGTSDEKSGHERDRSCRRQHNSEGNLRNHHHLSLRPLDEEPLTWRFMTLCYKRQFQSKLKWNSRDSKELHSWETCCFPSFLREMIFSCPCGLFGSLLKTKLRKWPTTQPLWFRMFVHLPTKPFSLVKLFYSLIAWHHPFPWSLFKRVEGTRSLRDRRESWNMI